MTINNLCDYYNLPTYCLLHQHSSEEEFLQGIIVICLLMFPALLCSSSGYNSLQVQEEQVFKTWADMESTLQRRGDLIQNLVETVKGYAKHERETLEAVIKACAQATTVQLKPEELGNGAAMSRFQEAQGNRAGYCF